MHFRGITEHEGLHGFGSLIIKGAEQALLNVVIDDRAKLRRVQIVLNETVHRPPLVQRLSRHLSAIWQRPLVRIEVEIEEVKLARSKETTLIPLRDIVIVPGLMICHLLTWVVRNVDCLRRRVCPARVDDKSRTGPYLETKTRFGSETLCCATSAT